MVIFDSRLMGYSAQEARDYLTWISAEPQALATYLGVFRQLDTLFPVLLALALGGALWLNASPAHPARRVLMLGAPAAYLVMDLMENAKVAEILRAGVSASDEMIGQASDFTTLKWTLLAVTLLLALSVWRRGRKGDAA